MKPFLTILVLFTILISVAGCAARPNEYENKTVETGEIAGFWQGLWQGFVSPFTFIISLFSHDVGVYDVHNNGGWYNFGFLLGAAIIFGGGGRGTHRRK